jgi:ribosomal protein L37E
VAKERTPNLSRIKEGVIAEIRWFAKRGEALNISAVKRSHPKLIEVVFDVRPFWGWKQALEDAGLDYSAIRVELTETVECRECGRRQLRLQHHLGSAHGLTSEAYLRRYPTASIAADKWQAETYPLSTGVSDFPHWEPLWTPEYVMDRLHHMHKRGMPLHSTAVQKSEPALLTTAIRLFGSWDEALANADVPVEATRLRQAAAPRDAESLVSFLKARASEGKPLSYKSMQSDHPGVLCAIRKVFGGYREALKAGGFDASVLCKRGRSVSAYPTRESIVDAIRRRQSEGKKLNASSVAQSPDGDSALHSRAVRMFGSWRKALSEAGIDPDAVSAWKYRAPDAVLGAIRGRIAAGVPHGAKHVLKGENADTSLYAASVRHFGGWVNALKAIGISYRPPRRKALYATRDAVLDAIRKRHGAGQALTGVGVRTGEGADWSLYGAADRLFGSWADAVHAAAPDVRVRVRRRSAVPTAAETASPKAAGAPAAPRGAPVPGAAKEPSIPSAKEPPIPAAKTAPSPATKPGESPATLEDLIRNMGLGD